jgi:hypothetical protein
LPPCNHVFVVYFLRQRIFTCNRSNLVTGLSLRNRCSARNGSCNQLRFKILSFQKEAFYRRRLAHGLGFSQSVHVCYDFTNDYASHFWGVRSCLELQLRDKSRFESTFLRPSNKKSIIIDTLPVSTRSVTYNASRRSPKSTMVTHFKNFRAESHPRSARVTRR